MIFFLVSNTGDGNLYSQPITASSLTAAAAQVKQLYGAGLNGDNQTPVNVALFVPDQIGTVTPDGSGNPANATLTATGDGANQATVRQNAQTAVTNNQTYLGLASPTNAQVVAQVAALTRQMNGLIKFVLGDFSSSS